MSTVDILLGNEPNKKKATAPPSFLSPKSNITVPSTATPQKSGNASDGITVDMLTRKETRQPQEGNASLGVRQDLLTNPKSAPKQEKPAAEQDDEPQQQTETDKFIAMLKKERDDAARREETPEKRAKRERRERTQNTIASIADAVRAMSNLYFTSQYAPNMYSSGNTLAGKAQERFDKAKAERDKNHDEYLNLSYKLANVDAADRANKAAVAAAKAKAERQARLDAEAKERADAELALKKEDLERQKQRDRVNAQIEQEKLKETKQKNKAAQAIAWARVNKPSSGGRHASKRYYTAAERKTAWDEWWKYTEEERRTWRDSYLYLEDGKEMDDDAVLAVKEMHDSWLSDPNNAAKSRTQKKFNANNYKRGSKSTTKPPLN